MRLKERAAALTVASVLAGFLVPPGTALATRGDFSTARQFTSAHESAPEEENSEDGGEDPEQSEAQSEAVNESDEPGNHGDGGDNPKDHDDKSPCTSISSISVCIDQPR